MLTKMTIQLPPIIYVKGNEQNILYFISKLTTFGFKIVGNKPQKLEKIVWEINESKRTIKIKTFKKKVEAIQNFYDLDKTSHSNLICLLKLNILKRGTPPKKKSNGRRTGKKSKR